MDDNKIIRKKQLLIRRDEILEAIGFDLYETGNLPPRFQSMRLDFNNMDILLTQLKDRFHALQEERNKVRAEELECLAQLSKVEHFWEKELSIPLRDQEEAKLRLHCVTDRLGDQEKLIVMKKEVEQTCSLVTELTLARRKAVAAVNEQLKPLRIRLQKLESAMNQVQTEAEHLSQNRQRKFRDLAYHFYKRGLEKQQFGARFTLLDHLRRELGDNHKPPHPENIAISRKPESRISWNWLVVLTLLVVFISIHFRVKFFQQSDVLASVASGLHRSDEASLTFFADLNTIDRNRIDTDWPDLKTLPAGSGLLKDMSRDDIQQVTLSRSQQADILFCGLRTKIPISNFGQKLVRQGWHRLPTKRNRQAFTNKEFIWLALGPREYLLIPDREFSRFQKMEINSTTDNFWLHEQIQPFDNNSPLLQGFDQVTIKSNRDTFTIELTGDIQALEPDLRSRFLLMLTEKHFDEGLRYGLNGNVFTITGPASLFKPEHLTGLPLVNFIKSLMDRLTSRPMIKDLEFNTAFGKQVKGGNYITVMTGGRKNLTYVSSFSAGGQVSDLVFLSRQNRLLATDTAARSLRTWRLKGSLLEDDGVLEFNNNQDRVMDAPFNPSVIVAGPQENLVALLEKDPFFKGTPRVAILRTSDMTVQWMIDLPKEVANSICGAWDQEGNTLVLGCSSRKMQGKSALAVLLYHFQDGEPRLFQLIDLAHDGSAPPAIHSLAWNTRENQLFLFQAPQQNLIRYALDRTSNSILDILPFGLMSSGEKPMAPQLRLNRTGDRGVLLGAGPSNAYIHLLSLSQEEMILLDQFNPGFQPSSILRIPMTDRFWVTSREKGLVAVVRINNGKLEHESQTPLTDFRPGLMTSDTWGNLLFLATDYRPTKR